METSENLFGFEQIGVGSESDSTLIFEEIRKEEEEYQLGESDDTDSTDGVFDFLGALSEKIPEEFDELLDDNTDKKRFIRALTRIFVLPLNTKIDTHEKIKKKILKIAIETTIEIWSGQNLLQEDHPKKVYSIGMDGQQRVQ